MADQQTTTTTTQAPEGQAPTTAVQPNGNAAPTADDFAKLKSEFDRVLSHKGELEKDLAKYRARNDEEIKKAQAEKAAIEAKFKEQGDHLKLYEMEKEKRAALEAQLADLSPKASQWEAVAKTMSERIEAAKASPDLPAYVKKAISHAANPAAALDILDEFRAEQAKAQPASKQPAPHAPAQGAAPAAQPPSKKLDDMTPAEIHSLTPEQKQTLFRPTSSARTPIKWF